MVVWNSGFRENRYVLCLHLLTMNQILMLGVLCSTIIEHVQNICSSDEGPVSFCIYYYFDFKDRRRQNLDGFIRSALAQFCQQNTTIPREEENVSVWSLMGRRFFQQIQLLSRVSRPQAARQHRHPIPPPPSMK